MRSIWLVSIIIKVLFPNICLNVSRHKRTPLEPFGSPLRSRQQPESHWDSVHFPETYLQTRPPQKICSICMDFTHPSHHLFEFCPPGTQNKAFKYPCFQLRNAFYPWSSESSELVRQLPFIIRPTAPVSLWDNWSHLHSHSAPWLQLIH